ncbi:MAG: hypothetical protein ACRYFU_07095 [Janthinobacterium lividum]
MSTPLRTSGSTIATSHTKLGFNADAAAIVIALALAALIRFNVIHHIGW